MNCPIDKTPLEKKIYEGNVEIDFCPECAGIWLDAGELEKIQEIRENDYSNKFAEHYDSRTEFESQLEEESRDCPSCDDVLIKKIYAGNSGIQIDACPACRGIWLDAGELQRLEIFFEKARAANPGASRLGLFWSGIKNFFVK